MSNEMKELFADVMNLIHSAGVEASCKITEEVHNFHPTHPEGKMSWNVYISPIGGHSFWILDLEDIDMILPAVKEYLFTELEIKNA